jgi:UDPglucose 6-dehydrogenase
VRVGIIGAGRVGLVAGACLADAGHRFVCHDLNAERIAQLQRRQTPFFEPGLAELVTQGVEAKRLSFTARYEDAVQQSEAVLICVGTPLGADGTLDLSAVLSAARSVASHIRSYTVVIVKSTVLVDTSSRVINAIRDEAAAGTEFDVVSMPEFLREGSAVDNFQHPDRLIVGSDSSRAMERVKELFGHLQCPMLVTTHREAELIKQVANCFLAVKVSFANSVGAVCDRIGIDVTTIMKGVGADSRIGSTYLGAGLGYGGSCLPKDMEGLIAFAQAIGVDVPLLESAQAVNAQQPKRYVSRIESHLGDLSGKTVALLGLAFKPGTDTMVAAPSVDLFRILRGKLATVRVFDPVAMQTARRIFGENALYAVDEYDACAGADAAILVTEWPRFVSLDWDRIRRSMRSPVFVDSRHFLSEAALAAAGFKLGVTEARQQIA